MNETIVFNTDISSVSDEEEQRLRKDLIQRATTRLRHRLLEQGLQDVLHQVVALQTELQSLHLDTTATLDSISTVDLDDTQKLNRQLDVLERRFDAHKSKLFGLKDQHEQQQNKHEQQDQQLPLKSVHDKTYSMSRLSSLSLMSSLFTRSNPSSSRATSIVSGDEKIHHHQTQMEEDHPFYDLAGKRSFGAGSFCGSVYSDDNLEQPIHVPLLSNNLSEIRYKRRQRRQQRQQHYDTQIDDDSASVFSDDSSVSSLSHLVLSNAAAVSSSHPVFLQHPLTPTTPPPCYTGHFFDSPQFDNPPACWTDQYYYQLEKQPFDYNTTHLYPQRNVLDDAISFLDGLKENEDDGGFGEDMYLLLQNPDLCCRPLSEIETKINKLRRQEKQQLMLHDVIHLLKPTTWVQLGIQYSGAMLYDVTCTSLDWCRFLSVLSAAVIISLMKGPEEIKRPSLYY